MIGQAQGQGRDRKRRVDVADRRVHRAAGDIEVRQAMDLRVGVNHAQTRVVVHARGSHVVGAARLPRATAPPRRLRALFENGRSQRGRPRRRSARGRAECRTCRDR